MTRPKKKTAKEKLMKALPPRPTGLPGGDYSSDRAPAHMRKNSAPYVKRERLPGEALPRTSSWKKGGIYDGSDLKPFTNRPGALIAYGLPSKGTGDV